MATFICLDGTLLCLVLVPRRTDTSDADLENKGNWRKWQQAAAARAGITLLLAGGLGLQLSSLLNRKLGVLLPLALDVFLVIRGHLLE